MTPFSPRKIPGKDLFVLECRFSLASWKVAGTIPNIDLRLSDKRLFLLMNHVQSVPFPQSKHPAVLPNTEVSARRRRASTEGEVFLVGV